MHDHRNDGAEAPGLAAPKRARDAHPGLAPLGAAGASPGGLSPPHKDEAPTGINGQRFRGQGTTDNADFAARDAVAQADKAFATLRARLALAGFTVQIVSDGACGSAYLVQRLCISRTLPDQAAVREFADRVGARA